jgi:multimeric flavodoxin WrbA
MKVLGLSGSPRLGANTDTVVKTILQGAENAGAQTEFLNITQSGINGCKACMYCRSNEGCAQKDGMQDIYKKIAGADAVVIGSPVYMFQMTSQNKAVMDRLLPFMRPGFSSQNSKPTGLVFTQGNDNLESFKPYFQHSANAYSMLGFPVKDTIVVEDNAENGVPALDKATITKLLKSGETIGKC